MKKKTQFTADPSTDREKKNLLFLNLIKSRKSTSRTELSRLTEINVVTVSNYVNSYLKKGLVLEHGYDISSGGRRPELIELNKEWGYTVGIDLAPDCIKGVLLDLNIQALASDSVEGYGKKDFRDVTIRSTDSHSIYRSSMGQPYRNVRILTPGTPKKESKFYRWLKNLFE